MNEVNQTNFDCDEQARLWSETIFRGFGHKGKQSPEVFFEAVKLYMGENKFQNMVEHHTANDEEGDF